MNYPPLPTFNYGWDTLKRTPEPQVYSGSTAMMEVRMSGELDPKIGERLVFSAICRLQPTCGNKILCNRGVLK